MKIAFFVRKFPNLSETFVVNQIVGLLEQGHDIDIYALEAGDISKIGFGDNKYDLLNRTYYRAAFPKKYMLRASKGLFIFFRFLFSAPIEILKCLNFLKYGRKSISFRLLFTIVPFLKNRHKNYQILHCHFADVGSWGVLINEIISLNAKIITTFHGYDITAIPSQILANPYKLLFKKGDLFTAGSNFIMNQAVSLGCPPEKLVKQPMGIYTSSYKFTTRTLKNEEPIKLLTVARLVEKKGIEYSIRAVSKALKIYPNINYTIAGDGPLRESLESLAKELGIETNVQMLGWQTNDQVKELYADSHIFILSSVTAANGDKEGQGLVLQEAQAMGLPVLSTIHNGFPDSIKDGFSGFLVPERDIEALTERLIFLIENPEAWAKMGLTGRCFVEDFFDNKVLTQKLISIYFSSLE